MTWALASLAAQKVLLLVASHEVFLYLVAALGLAALLTLLYAPPRIRSLAFRTFLVVVFVRFSLGLAVALNSGADYLFLERQVEANNAEIEKFQSRVIGIDSSEELDGESIRNSAIRFWRGLSLDELERRVSAGIENFINLVALFLLKTIVFPLGFFYLAYYVVRALWRFDLNPPPP
jgi:hypothetical protein